MKKDSVSLCLHRSQKNISPENPQISIFVQFQGWVTVDLDPVGSFVYIRGQKNISHENTQIVILL